MYKLAKFKNSINKVNVILIALILAMFMTGCTSSETVKNDTSKENTVVENSNKKEDTNKKKENSNKENNKKSNKKYNLNKKSFDGYVKLSENTCNLSGSRKSKVAVNVGVGNREYWAFTNESGQLVKVVADKVIVQNDKKEDVQSNGRYCKDEAKVPGVERSDLDEGHVIADSLGGASNAYNITPQDSHLNRHGAQADMEEEIRKAGGCTDFVAIITYPNKETQIPSHYSYTYKINGKTKKVEFDNNGTKKSSSSSKKKTTNKQSSTVSKPTSNKKPNTSNKPTSNSSSTSNKVNSNQVVENEPIEGKVWISSTGKKYHSVNNCGRMNPHKAKQVTVSEAKNMGLEPCNKCF